MPGDLEYPAVLYNRCFVSRICFMPLLNFKFRRFSMFAYNNRGEGGGGTQDSRVGRTGGVWVIVQVITKP